MFFNENKFIYLEKSFFYFLLREIVYKEFLPNFIFIHMQRTSFKLEFVLKTSTAIVYKFLTSPDCLIRWFCDKVIIEREEEGDIYTYSWSGEEEVAILIDDIEEERLRFKWEDADDEEEYLEFTMSRSEVTGDTIFEIFDYCDDDEVEDQKQLWINQIGAMKTAMGIR